MDTYSYLSESGRPGSKSSPRNIPLPLPYLSVTSFYPIHHHSTTPTYLPYLPYLPDLTFSPQPQPCAVCTLLSPTRNLRRDTPSIRTTCKPSTNRLLVFAVIRILKRTCIRRNTPFCKSLKHSHPLPHTPNTTHLPFLTAEPSSYGPPFSTPRQPRPARSISASSQRHRNRSPALRPQLPLALLHFACVFLGPSSAHIIAVTLTSAPTHTLRAVQLDCRVAHLSSVHILPALRDSLSLFPHY